MKGSRNMKLLLVTLLGMGALVLAGCASSEPIEQQQHQIFYTSQNPATVVEEVDGVQYVYLTEGPAHFVEDSVDVRAGKVVFYVTNEADKDVTLMVTPARQREAKHALFRLNVPKYSTALQEIKLKPGHYEYSCPVNHTEFYPLEVHGQ